MTILKDNECLVWENEDGKHVLVLWNDENDRNPRDEDVFAQEDHMVCWSRSYRLGDEHNYDTPCDFAQELADGFSVEYSEDDNPDDIMNRLAEKDFLVYLPLWVYAHSDIRMSCGKRVYPFNDRFDSGRAGYIYVTKEEAFGMGYTEENWKEKALAMMEGNVKIYSYYLQDEVYGYTCYVQSEDGMPFETEDECTGFYGFDIDESGVRWCADVPDSAVIRKYDDVFGECEIV